MIDPSLPDFAMSLAGLVTGLACWRHFTPTHIEDELLPGIGQLRYERDQRWEAVKLSVEASVYHHWKGKPLLEKIADYGRAEQRLGRMQEMQHSPETPE